jgi:hypothetical protein
MRAVPVFQFLVQLLAQSQILPGEKPKPLFEFFKVVGQGGVSGGQ